MDDALVRQLEPWPAFRKVDRPDFQERDFANHCPPPAARCRRTSICIPSRTTLFSATPGSIKLTPLVGRIQLSDDEHFEIC
ncbi:MAG: hypothetical protein JWM63_2614 [Gammaproteobacteria bacterium]|nr:hypothetical protein [Gammaproteobacteria bacterium]